MEQPKKPIEYHGTVLRAKRLAGDYYHVRLSLSLPETIAFTAGQYVIFHIGPPKLRHTLSIASVPTDKNAIEMLQGTAPMGEGSKWILGLKPGDPVSFVGPVGKFVMPKNSGKQKVFVATGCGIAPIRSMLSDYLGTGGRAPVVLYWGLRFESDLFWQEELADFVAAHQNFTYHVTLSKPTDHWQAMKGRVTDHVVDNVSGLLESEFYLCGNREMIVEMRKLLMDAGVTSDQIFTEIFF